MDTAGNVRNLGDYARIRTGKLDANESSPQGKYPFFTCAKNPLRINTFSYDCECVLVAGNGDLNVKYFDGKFDAYQRTYLIESLDKTQLHLRYLYYFMSIYVERLRVQSIGGVIKYIKLGNLTDAKIPLPPLSEQKRIADILDKADAIRRKRREASKLTRTLENALFAEMFLVDRDSIRQKICVLDELCSVIRDGVHKTPNYVSKGIPFVTVKNLTAIPNGISFDNCKFISPEDHADFCRRTDPEIGDILVSKDGTIGVAREVTEGLPFNIFVSVALLKPKRNIIHSTFLKTQFNMPFVQRQVLDEIKGVAIRHLHLKDFKRLSIVVPSMSMQSQFVKRIQRIERSEDKHFSAIRQADDFFNALVQCAFKGEL